MSIDAPIGISENPIIRECPEDYAPEPPRPDPRLRDYVFGAVLFGLLVVVDWVTRRR